MLLSRHRRSEFVLQRCDRGIHVRLRIAGYCLNCWESNASISASQYARQLNERTFRWREATFIASREGAFLPWGTWFYPARRAVYFAHECNTTRTSSPRVSKLISSSVSDADERYTYAKRNVMPFISFHLFAHENQWRIDIAASSAVSIPDDERPNLK
jgi:hypothetical protein